LIKPRPVCDEQATIRSFRTLSVMHVFRGTPILAKESTALTIGNFDGVHLGHQAMIIRLNEAAAQLNLTPCVMIFEPHPREFFTPDQAPTRLTSLREKLELLAELNVERVQVCHFNFNFASISAEGACCPLDIGR